MRCKNFLKVHKNTGEKMFAKYLSADGCFVKTILLRILTGKKHHKIKLQRLRKIRIRTFGSLVHQIKSF